MKNIERKQVQKALAKALSHDKGNITELYKLGMPKRATPEQKYKWLNSEYMPKLNILDYNLLQCLQACGYQNLSMEHLHEIQKIGYLKDIEQVNSIEELIEYFRKL